MANRLIQETSPYLLQHAHNPVDWFAWGEDALAAARAAGKPILLSVGYSACHWCHVMERESFEDPKTAGYMNAHFVNVKVDREERPDVDEIYMSAVQAFTGGHGGWPMTVFLTPDGRPFLGGTYFPPAASRGMPSFRQVMEHALHLFAKEPRQAGAIADRVLERVRSGERLPRAADELRSRWLGPVARGCEEDFDEKDGGFGGAPKFPPHGTLSALLAHWRRSGEARSLEMVIATLDAMAKGGMYDLAGGGFARYSVDEEWRIPHFEKMLYDNALLVPVYLDAFAATGGAGGSRPWYARIARESLNWVLREMTSPEGGFHSALDADSEGHEGKFYVWTVQELREVLGAGEGARAASLLGVRQHGTFEETTSVLRLDEPLETLREDDRALVERVLPKLLEARSRRVRPGRDEKIITAWNGLMIGAFARGAAVLGEPRYGAAARRAAEFLGTRLVEKGRLLRTHKDGRSRFLGYLDDHAFFVLGLLDLFDAEQDSRWVSRAVHWAEQAIDLFWDPEDGGFFYTGRDAEKLVARSKNLLGGALPSANGAMTLALAKLDALLERRDFGERADRVLRSYQPILDRAPRAIGIEAIAAEWRTGASQEIAILGPPGGVEPFAREVHRRYMPFRVMVAGGGGVEDFPWLEGKSAIGGAATGWLCVNRACLLPAVDLEQWRARLDQAIRPAAAGEGEEGGGVRAPELPAEASEWLNAPEPLSIVGLRGGIVVLDFWTYCCINCMHVLPELAAIEERFAGRPVTVIGVHSAKFDAEKVRENVARAIERHGISHPVVLDSDHRIWDAYAVKAWPTIAVIDPEGRVAWQKSGEIDRAEIGRVIERLLPGAASEPPRGAPVARAAASSSGTLRFPEKVHVFPDSVAQSTGADPFGPDARLYLADTGHHRILECSLSLGPDGWPAAARLRQLGAGEAGLRDGPAEEARFRSPRGMSRRGTLLWLADTENHALRAIDVKSGSVVTVAGTGERGRGGRGRPDRPRELALRSPWDVAALEGGVIVAMAGAHQIWVYLPEHDRIGPLIGTGAEAHIDGNAGEAALAQPSGLALFGRHLFWADSETSSIRLADLEDHKVATIAGKGLFDFGDADGDSDEVRLQHPLGVAVAEGSEVYVADTYNHKVKVIDLQGGKTRTLAAGLCEPGGLAVAGEFLIVADTGNHRIVAVQRKTGETRPLRGLE